MGLRMAADAAATQSDTDEDAHDAFRRDLIQGLSRTQKAVPPKWFYDAEGSRLFEEITRLPEYYPTRQETALLRGTAGDLAAMFGPQAVLVEFGSGASEKTRILLDAAPDLAAYVPLDISKAALDAAATALRQDYPALPVAPVLGDFETLAALPEELGKGRKIGFFPGSTIGNLEPEQAIRFLREARRMLGDEALFILGVDLVKDPGVLTAAYDDGQGVKRRSIETCWCGRTGNSAPTSTWTPLSIARSGDRTNHGWRCICAPRGRPASMWPAGGSCFRPARRCTPKARASSRARWWRPWVRPPVGRYAASTSPMIQPWLWPRSPRTD